MSWRSLETKRVIQVGYIQYTYSRWGAENFYTKRRIETFFTFTIHVHTFISFSYGSCLENQSDSIGVRFDDLHLCRYSSCVTDILYFLFTTVDCDVRRDHAFNFIAAYYDHFNKVNYIICYYSLKIELVIFIVITVQYFYIYIFTHSIKDGSYPGTKTSSYFHP